MRGWLRALGFFVCCLAVFAALRVLRAADEELPAPSQGDLQARHGVPVEVASAQLRRVNRSVVLYGTARGAEQAEVIATSPNILQRLHVAVGEPVRRGQLLASMRSVSLSPLGYPYEPLKVQHEALQAELDRLRPLYDQGAVTRQQLEQLEAQAQAAEAQFDSAKAAVSITAPIAGTVTRIDFQPGQMVPNDRPLMQLARIDSLLLEFMVEATDVAHIAEGMDVQVRASALPDRVFEGRVVERSLGAYPVINQFRVRVELPNPDLALLPGFPVEATVLAGSAEPVLAVPRRALVEQGEQVALWVVDQQGLSRQVVVAPGVRDDSWVAVQGELSAGDRVVTLGQRFLDRDGQPLIVVDGG